MKHILSAFIALSLIACTTSPFPKGEAAYRQKIEKFSAGDKQFAGFYHNFEFRATVLNSDVVQTVNQRLTQVYEWDEAERQEKLQKEMAKLRKSTRMWMSFFTPNANNDNLATKKTIWKIYLQAGNQRYEGRAEKANKNLSEASSLFPYHNRWTTAYYLNFPVPTSDVEGQPLKLIITGPLGKREVEFPAESTVR